MTSGCIVAHNIDVRVITCSWRNSNQEMYDDDIGIFVDCFQIFSLKSVIVPYLLVLVLFPSDHQFSFIILNEIMTYQIYQLYLVARYVERHVLSGSPLCCFRCRPLPAKYQTDVPAFQFILDGSHGVDYVVFNGATNIVGERTHHNTTHSSTTTTSVTLWIRLDCSTWSFVFRTAFD